VVGELQPVTTNVVLVVILEPIKKAIVVVIIIYVFAASIISVHHVRPSGKANEVKGSMHDRVLGEIKHRGHQKYAKMK
jgi:hypothetical protein